MTGSVAKSQDGSEADPETAWSRFSRDGPKSSTLYTPSSLFHISYLTK